MYSDDSDYDPYLDSDEESISYVDESSINKRTHLKLVGAQFAVNQQQIVATEALGVSYFAHPAQGSHRMKGGFSVGKNSGQIILDGMVEQASTADGQTANVLARTVVFQFNDMTAWCNFVNQLKGVNYVGP